MKLSRGCVAALSTVLLLGTAAADPSAVRVQATATSEVAGAPAWKAIHPLGEWCTDQGAGQRLTLAFEPKMTIGKVELDFGSASPKKQGAEPTEVKISFGVKTFTAKPDDGTATVDLGGVSISSLAFELVAVGTGKSNQSCLRNIAFRDPQGTLYPIVLGIDKAAHDALPAFVAKVDAALKACDATVLGEVVGFPLVQTHTTFKWIQGNDVPYEKKTKHKNVKALLKACTKRGSFLVHGYGSGDDRGDDVTKGLARAESPRPGVVVVGNEANFVVTWANDRWTLTGIGTVKPAD